MDNAEQESWPAAEALGARNGDGDANGPASHSPDSHTTSRRRSRLRLRSVVAGMLIGVAVAGCGWLIAIAVFMHDRLPLMTADEVHAANQRWSEHHPAGYDLDLLQQGANKGQIHVEVRGGSVTAMTRDGIATPPGTWPYWSVNGLFRIIGDDTERNQQAILRHIPQHRYAPRRQRRPHRRVRSLLKLQYQMSPPVPHRRIDRHHGSGPRRADLARLQPQRRLRTQ